jgi:hypothetical protein
LAGGLTGVGQNYMLSQILASKNQTPTGYGNPVQQNPMENVG